MLSTLLAPASFARDPLGLPTPEDKSPWFRLYVAGEESYEKQDLDTAKKYWSAALRALETDRHPIKHDDIFFTVKLSALEQRFTEAYPKNYDKEQLSDEDRLKLRMEQVETLRRIVNVNYRLVSPRDRLVSASRERYDKALKELRAELKQQKNGIASTSSAQRTVVPQRSAGQRSYLSSSQMAKRVLPRFGTRPLALAQRQDNGTAVQAAPAPSGVDERTGLIYMNDYRGLGRSHN